MKNYIIKSISIIIIFSLSVNNTQILSMQNIDDITETITIEENNIEKMNNYKPSWSIDIDSQNAGSFKKIPREVIHNILKFLKPKSLKTFRILNKHLHKIADETITQIDISTLIHDPKKLTETKKVICEEKIKTIIKKIEKKILQNEPMLFIYKKACKKLGLHQLYSYNFKYHLYKIIKNEIKSYQNAYTQEDNKIKLIQIIIGLILCIFSGCIPGISTGIITIIGVGLLVCNMIMTMFDFPIIVGMNIAIYTFILISSIVLIAAICAGGALCSWCISKRLRSQIHKILTYFNNIKLERLYNENNLEKIIFGANTNKIQNLLLDLESLEKIEEKNKNEQILSEQKEHLKEALSEIIKKQKENFINIETDIAKLKTNNILKENEIILEDDFSEENLNIKEEMKKITNKINLIKSKQNNNKKLFLQQYKIKLFKKLEKEILRKKSKKKKKITTKEIRLELEDV